MEVFFLFFFLGKYEKKKTKHSREIKRGRKKRIKCSPEGVAIRFSRGSLSKTVWSVQYKKKKRARIQKRFRKQTKMKRVF